MCDPQCGTSRPWNHLGVGVPPSGLVLCATARGVHEPSTANFAAFTLPLLAATMRWIPTVQVLDAGVLGAVFLGAIDDAETRLWARGQLRRTSLTTAISAIQAV